MSFSQRREKSKCRILLEQKRLLCAPRRLVKLFSFSFFFFLTREKNIHIEKKNFFVYFLRPSKKNWICRADFVSCIGGYSFLRLDRSERSFFSLSFLYTFQRDSSRINFLHIYAEPCIAGQGSVFLYTNISGTTYNRTQSFFFFLFYSITSYKWLTE